MLFYSDKAIAERLKDQKIADRLKVKSVPAVPEVVEQKTSPPITILRGVVDPEDWTKLHHLPSHQELINDRRTTGYPTAVGSHTCSPLRRKDTMTHSWMESAPRFTDEGTM